MLIGSMPSPQDVTWSPYGSRHVAPSTADHAFDMSRPAGERERPEVAGMTVIGRRKRGRFLVVHEHTFVYDRDVETGPITALADAIDALAAEEVAGRSQAESLVALHRLQARLDAEVTRRLGALDRSDEWARDGARSSAGWLVGHCRLALSDARRRRKVARQARAMPAAADAWQAGRITSTHMDVLAR
ncbi:MAG: hypothetical protein JWL83_3029, partial [Actinomycetia bacterium]|nr:hypothetical protein [Actinomycetes bacterium]